MKQAMINYIQQARNDELYTPEKAVKPILEFIPKDKIIWECTAIQNSSISKLLRERGNKVIDTHIENGFDFLEDTPNFDFDIIITNPPYSLKNDFLKKAYSYGEPFAFLLPITTLESITRGELFRKYGIQVLVLDRRINFMKNKDSCWFNTSWFCWKLLPNNLMFKRLNN